MFHVKHGIWHVGRGGLRTKWVTCGSCDKRGYFTKNFAREARQQQRPRDHRQLGRRAAEDSTDALHVYRCTAGTGLWHLGHRITLEQRQRQQVQQGRQQGRHRQQNRHERES